MNSIGYSYNDTLTGKNLLPLSKQRAHKVVTGQPSSLITLRASNICCGFVCVC